MSVYEPMVIMINMSQPLMNNFCEWINSTQISKGHGKYQVAFEAYWNISWIYDGYMIEGLWLIQGVWHTFLSLTNTSQLINIPTLPSPHYTYDNTSKLTATFIDITPPEEKGSIL